MVDHVRMLVSIASKISVVSFIGYLKGKCARLITAWSRTRTLPRVHIRCSLFLQRSFCNQQTKKLSQIAHSFHHSSLMVEEWTNLDGKRFRQSIQKLA